ncbi:MAG: heparinase II/III family protein [Proteobacteria bacterium]|nr:heparinase II/III family protein [Pseudomonadota bacterium]
MRVLVLLALIGCKQTEEEAEYVGLIVDNSDREALLARIDTAPYDLMYAAMVETASEPIEIAEPGPWDHNLHGHNGDRAQSAAFLAWLHEDESYADTVREAFDALETDVLTTETSDVNIRMPHTTISYTNAWDLMELGGYWDEADRAEARDKILEVTDATFERFHDDDVYRNVWLKPAQNNHPIRTSAAVGYPALRFADHRDAEEWSDWAASELEYLWGPDGQYVQPDGGVSEGPFYYGFALSPSLAYFSAVDRLHPEGMAATRDCINRSDLDPWTGHGCVDGDAFTFANPIRDPLFHATVDWSIGIRLPDGSRPPLADSYFNPLNGAAILTGFGGEGHTHWDWANNVERPYTTHHGLDLSPYHFVYVAPDVEPVEPPWTTRILPDAGTATFRSDWSEDARYLLLVAESGSARKTLHDHADGTSFSLAAYGEYLLVDPGYYKPNSLNNAVTSSPESHNVLLIDGVGGPDKGLLTNFGDTDSSLENAIVGEHLAYAEAHIAYDEADIERSVWMVDGRYFIIADRIDGDAASRSYAFRVGGYAGYGVGGSFELSGAQFNVERDKAGIDVRVGTTAGAPTFVEPEFVENASPHVHKLALNREVNHHVVADATVQAAAPGFLTVLAPYKVNGTGDDAPLAVTALTGLPTGWTGWDVAGDRVLQRDPGSAETATLSDGTVIQTDAEAVFLGASAQLRVRGTHVTVDGSATLDQAGAVQLAE